jgi:lipopolysaccharide transport system permease protein
MGSTAFSKGGDIPVDGAALTKRGKYGKISSLGRIASKNDDNASALHNNTMKENNCMAEAAAIRSGGFMRKLLPLVDVTRLPRELWRNRSLLWQMTKRNIEQRYRGSMLGLLWSFVQPLMMLVVYTFVFSVVLKAKWGVSATEGKGAFAVIMFCGMTIFNLFSESLIGCSSVIVTNQNLVKKVIFPLEILPMTCVFTTYVLGLAWFILLFLGAYFILGFVGWTMLLIPVVMLPVMIFTSGVSYLVAALGVFVRDTQYVIGVLLQILFFATPIFYPVTAVPENLRWVLIWNPLTVFITQARNVFLYGKMPDWAFLGLATLVSVVVLQLGVFFFTRTKRGFADVF